MPLAPLTPVSSSAIQISPQQMTATPTGIPPTQQGQQQTSRPSPVVYWDVQTGQKPQVFVNAQGQFRTVYGESELRDIDRGVWRPYQGQVNYVGVTSGQRQADLIARQWETGAISPKIQEAYQAQQLKDIAPKPGEFGYHATAERPQGLYNLRASEQMATFQSMPINYAPGLVSPVDWMKDYGMPTPKKEEPQIFQLQKGHIIETYEYRPGIEFKDILGRVTKAQPNKLYVQGWLGFTTEKEMMVAPKISEEKASLLQFGEQVGAIGASGLIPIKAPEPGSILSEALSKIKVPSLALSLGKGGVKAPIKEVPFSPTEPFDITTGGIATGKPLYTASKSSLQVSEPIYTIKTGGLATEPSYLSNIKGGAFGLVALKPIQPQAQEVKGTELKPTEKPGIPEEWYGKKSEIGYGGEYSKVGIGGERTQIVLGEQLKPIARDLTVPEPREVYPYGRSSPLTDRLVTPGESAIEIPKARISGISGERIATFEATKQLATVDKDILRVAPPHSPFEIDTSLKPEKVNEFASALADSMRKQGLDLEVKGSQLVERGAPDNIIANIDYFNKAKVEGGAAQFTDKFNLELMGDKSLAGYKVPKGGIGGDAGTYTPQNPYYDIPERLPGYEPKAKVSIRRDLTAELAKRRAESTAALESKAKSQGFTTTSQGQVVILEKPTVSVAKTGFKQEAIQISDFGTEQRYLSDRMQIPLLFPRTIQRSITNQVSRQVYKPEIIQVSTQAYNPIQVYKQVPVQVPKSIQVTPSMQISPQISGTTQAQQSEHIQESIAESLQMPKALELPKYDLERKKKKLKGKKAEKYFATFRASPIAKPSTDLSSVRKSMGLVAPKKRRKKAKK